MLSMELKFSKVMLDSEWPMNSDVNKSEITAQGTIFFGVGKLTEPSLDQPGRWRTNGTVATPQTRTD